MVAVVEPDGEQLARRGGGSAQVTGIEGTPGRQRGTARPGPEGGEVLVHGLHLGPESAAGGLGDVDGQAVHDQAEAAGQVGDAHGGPFGQLAFRSARGQGADPLGGHGLVRSVHDGGDDVANCDQ